jgi:hypothetical protein
MFASITGTLRKKTRIKVSLVTKKVFFSKYKIRSVRWKTWTQSYKTLQNIFFNFTMIS